MAGDDLAVDAAGTRLAVLAWLGKSHVRWREAMRW